MRQNRKEEWDCFNFSTIFSTWSKAELRTPRLSNWNSAKMTGIQLINILGNQTVKYNIRKKFIFKYHGRKPYSRNWTFYFNPRLKLLLHCSSLLGFPVLYINVFHDFFLKCCFSWIFQISALHRGETKKSPWKKNWETGLPE